MLLLVPLVSLAEKNTHEGAAARASGLDVEAPRLRTAVLTSVMTASARVSDESNRTGYPAREPERERR